MQDWKGKEEAEPQSVCWKRDEKGPSVGDVEKVRILLKQPGQLLGSKQDCFDSNIEIYREHNSNAVNDTDRFFFLELRVWVCNQTTLLNNRQLIMESILANLFFL